MTSLSQEIEKEIENNQDIKNLTKDRLVLVVSKGTVDMLYPALVLAVTGAAMGMKVDLYFTFWGLNVLTKKGVNKVKIPAVGNTGMPMPNIVGVLPGMTDLATKMMKGKIAKFWPNIYDMIKEAKAGGAKLHACSPTMGFMGVKEEDFIPEVDDIVGASAFLGWASEPKALTLFI